MNDQYSQKIGVQCIKSKRLDQIHTEIRTYFIRAVIVDICRFFMVWARIALMIMILVTTFKCRYWQIVDKSLISENFFQMKLFFFWISFWVRQLEIVNSHLYKDVYVFNCHFSYLGEYWSTNINLILFEMFLRTKYFLEYEYTDLGTLEHFRFLYFFTKFYFSTSNFQNIFTESKFEHFCYWKYTFRAEFENKDFSG